MRDVKPMRRGERLLQRIRDNRPFPRRMRYVIPNYYAFTAYEAAARVRRYAAPLAKARAARLAMRLRVMDAMFQHCAELVRGACDQEAVSADWVRVVAMRLKQDILEAVGVYSDK